jgi:hypothetical protein
MRAREGERARARAQISTQSLRSRLKCTYWPHLDIRAGAGVAEMAMFLCDHEHAHAHVRTVMYAQSCTQIQQRNGVDTQARDCYVRRGREGGQETEGGGEGGEGGETR